jgi:hypothetical protein
MSVIKGRWRRSSYRYHVWVSGAALWGLASFLLARGDLSQLPWALCTTFFVLICLGLSVFGMSSLFSTAPGETEAPSNVIRLKPRVKHRR